MLPSIQISNSSYAATEVNESRLSYVAAFFEAPNLPLSPAMDGAEGVRGGDAVCRAPESFKCCPVGMRLFEHVLCRSRDATMQGCVSAYSVQLLSQLARIPVFYDRDNARNVNYRTRSMGPGSGRRSFKWQPNNKKELSRSTLV